MEKSSEVKSKFEWQHILELVLILVTVLGTTITLHLHMDTKVDSYNERMACKVDAYQARTYDILEGIRLDMKDFHGRLCAIEERNKKWEITVCGYLFHFFHFFSYSFWLHAMEYIQIINIKWKDLN